MECKLNFHTADDGDSDSDASEVWGWFRVRAKWPPSALSLLR